MNGGLQVRHGRDRQSSTALLVRDPFAFVFAPQWEQVMIVRTLLST